MGTEVLLIQVASYVVGKKATRSRSLAGRSLQCLLGDRQAEVVHLLLQQRVCRPLCRGAPGARAAAAAASGAAAGRADPASVPDGLDAEEAVVGHGRVPAVGAGRQVVHHVRGGWRLEGAMRSEQFRYVQRYLFRLQMINVISLALTEKSIPYAEELLLLFPLPLKAES